MAETKSYDLIVIGGGPGGYTGAIRAAQLGKKVAIVERDKLGGTCLNWGCIPTKALLAGAELYHKLTHEREEFGISAENISFDWSKVIARSRKVAGNLNAGVGFLMKKNKIDHYDGHALISKAAAGSPKTVEVYDLNDAEPTGEVGTNGVEKFKFGGEAKVVLNAPKVMVATGASPRPMPGSAFDGDKIISSKEAMLLEERPEKLLIVGSGAIGMEFAYVYNAYGTEVTIVEMLDRLVPIEDTDVSKAMLKAYKKLGIKVMTKNIVKSVEKTDKGIKALISAVDDESKTQELEADKVLVAIGVQGRFDGLFDESITIEIDRGHIKTATDYKLAGATYETNVPGIYAIGDVIGPPWLAHVAGEEAVLAVERMYGHDAPDVNYNAIPGCTYCSPQIASVGFTEQYCKENDIAYTTAKFPFQVSGKAQALNETQGFIKLIVGEEHQEVLGAHMVGEGVTEMIAEMGLAITLEATAEEIVATMHAHPTLSEAVHESALGINNRMINF
ncbi:Dihydrolipoyl dehydrogenase [Poriferisphaera corsica]|uniref:Dihydrolipoyl dehydrogenase n=1 Tax=Poriferisphaera corsica TaxID=2528020 RepID=A0A517YZH0_9BACT|nr:dihydrolipoyl dehydrogenase [Poriferisphaera corsica]QDU35611.1 Dihydrolipoyl dehydrogenase [Poriferisphaera corsica]